jgi:hypothetical protein
VTRRRREQDAEKAYFDHARRTLFPMIRDSRVYLGICPAAPDAKWCLELGAAIMFDKPLLFVVRPGVAVPAKLRRIADGVVEVEDLGSPEGQARIAAVLKEWTP